MKEVSKLWHDGRSIMDGSVPLDYVPQLRSKPPWLMEEMVAAEPSLVVPILGSREPAQLTADLIRKAAFDGRAIVVAGCGTSETAAMAVADLVTAALRRIGIDRPLVHARQALEASIDPWRGGVCVGISHEGSTRATIFALETAKEAGAATGLITARPESAGARLVDVVFVTPVVDRSWCHTVGYLSPILAGGAIASAVDGSHTDAAGFQQALAAAGGLTVQASSLAGNFSGVDRLVTIGSGSSRSAARELALKIEEGVWLPARMLELETVLHGHLAACDGETGMVLVATEAQERLLVRMRMAIDAARRIGVRVGAIVTAEVDEALGSQTSLPRIVMPAALGAYGLLGRLAGAAIALQKLTLALAAMAGTNPDLIRRQQERYREAAKIAESSTGW